MDEIVKYVQETDSYPADWVAWFRARTEDEIYLHDAIKSNIGKYYDTVSNNKPWDDVGGLTRATITIRSMREMPAQFRVPGTIDDAVDITAYLLHAIGNFAFYLICAPIFLPLLKKQKELIDVNKVKEFN